MAQRSAFSLDYVLYLYTTIVGCCLPRWMDSHFTKIRAHNFLSTAGTVCNNSMIWNHDLLDHNPSRLPNPFPDKNNNSSRYEIANMDFLRPYRTRTGHRLRPLNRLRNFY